jgi:hypothetical protein
MPIVFGYLLRISISTNELDDHAQHRHSTGHALPPGSAKGTEMSTIELNRRTIEMILAGDTKGLRIQADALSKQISHALGDVCPECGSKHTESNCKGREFQCGDCGHAWGDDGERYGY